MKIREIFVEFKKGVKAVKHNKKSKDPAKEFAKAKEKLEPVKPMEEGVAEAVKKPNATTRHLRDHPVSDKDVAKPVKKPEKKKPEQGVVEEGLNEFSPGRSDPWGDDDRGEDPYSRPKPRHYNRSSSYFEQFEADHFDDEVFNKQTGEFKGYWDDEEGRVQIAYFKFDNPKRTGSDDPGMGWYYEPQNESVAEGRFGRSSYYNPMDQERREQDAMDYERRAFKRAELQHELGHEDDPDFERNLRQQQIDRDRGPWYIKINGKNLKSKGEVKVFDWKKGANNYALAILKNKPELQGKIFLTKKAEDDVAESIKETASPGATSAGAVATLGMNPKLSPGPARGKKSYIGSPGKSGTKAPPQPKVKQPKSKYGTAKNALDMKHNIFGGGAIKRK